MKKWIPAAATAAGAYLIAIAPRLCERPERIPKVYYAHRGLHDNISDAPENSLAAFQKAVDAGYGIELDVQMTADGKVVVVHDFNLKRISGVDKEIDQCTYEELQEYPIYGSDQRVPLFEDVLKAVDGKVPLIVELKYKEGSKICEKAQELLNSYTGIYCIESFHPQVLVWYRKNYPHICRGQLSMNFERDENTKGAQYFALRHLLTNFLAKPDFIAYDCRAMHAVSKNICRNLFGCPSVAWTVKCQAQLDACSRSFDYFIFEGFAPKQ